MNGDYIAELNISPVITIELYMRFKWLALAGHTFQAN